MVILPAPMFPTPGRHPFFSSDWLYEPSFAGARCVVAACDAASVEMRTANGIDCTEWFPSLAKAFGRLPGGAHVLDGEICALDDSGEWDAEERSPAAWRLAVRAEKPLRFRAFDLLFEHGRNIMLLPLVERKARLGRLLNGVEGLVAAAAVEADPALVQDMLRLQRPRAIVVKKRASIYTPGLRSLDWIEIGADMWQRSFDAASPSCG